MSQNVFNNNPDLLLSDEENIDPVRIHRPKCTSKTFISMASESDSGFSATPSAASPAINSRAATDSPGLPTEVGSTSLNPEDSEAGPDINADAFTNEIFRDPSSFDFLSQHGSGNEAALALARQSLYVYVPDNYVIISSFRNKKRYKKKICSSEKKSCSSEKKVAVAKKKVAVAVNNIVEFFFCAQNNGFSFIISAYKVSKNAERCGTKRNVLFSIPRTFLLLLLGSRIRQALLQF